MVFEGVELEGNDSIFVHYYNYLKINQGVSFEDFCNEDGETIAVLLRLQHLEDKKINKKAKDNESKQSRHYSTGKRSSK